jgi:hypothetical protein
VLAPEGGKKRRKKGKRERRKGRKEEKRKKKSILHYYVLEVDLYFRVRKGIKFLGDECDSVHPNTLTSVLPKLSQYQKFFIKTCQLGL